MSEYNDFINARTPGMNPALGNQLIQGRSKGLEDRRLQADEARKEAQAERTRQAQGVATAAVESWKKGDKDGFRSNISSLAGFDQEAAAGLVKLFGSLDRTNFVEASYHIYNAARLTDTEAVNKSLIRAADTLNVPGEHPIRKEMLDIAAMPDGPDKTKRILWAYNYARLWGAYGDPATMLDQEKLRVQQGNLFVRIQEHNLNANKEDRIKKMAEWKKVYGDEPPEGYFWEEESGKLRIIPNGPEYVKRSEEKRKRTALFAENIFKGRRLLDQIGKASDEASWTTAGPIGFLLKFLPGTNSLDLKATIETIKANIGFDKLQNMRLQSPTGGALGQVAIQELDALQNSIASLDQAQSPSQLRANLKIVMQDYGRFLKAAEDEMERAKGMSLDDFMGTDSQGRVPAIADQIDEDTSTEDLLKVF